MTSRYKKLELVWPGKGEQVFPNPETGKWELCGRNSLPPRPLIETDAFGEERGKLFVPERSNLLIHGDSLHALQALLPYYAGRVKLIYIDPPFNTGNDFIAYDDSFAHSTWLSMMAARLRLIKRLLTRDGALFIHIDDNEAGHLRVLLDELLPGNFRNLLITKRIRKNIRERPKVKSINTGHDLIYFYARSEETLIKHPTVPVRREPRWHAFDAAGIRRGMDYPLFGHRPPKNRHWMFSKERAEKMIQEKTLRPHQKTGRPEYLIPATSESLVDTIWTDISAYAFRWEFPTEKSEELMQRIIGMATEPGDLVLDCFAGSGTTGAAAHKMRRRWIQVESESAQVKKITQRLHRVVQGKDDGGITKAVKWEKGGGFRLLEVGVPLLVQDPETQLTILNPKYTNGPLVRAVCAMEGFLLTGDGLLHGRNQDHYAHVTEAFVDDAYVRRLMRHLPDTNSSLTVYAVRGRRQVPSIPRAAIKRLNADLVKPYLTPSR